MPTFLTQSLHFTLLEATSVLTFFIATMILLVPLAGMLCDRVSRRKILLMNAALIALLTVPGFYLMTLQSAAIVFGVMAVFTVLSSLEQAATCVAVVENYPSPARYSGLSISYNLSNAVFGGTAPLVCAWLIGTTQFLLAPAFYIVICAIVTGLVIYFFVPDTRRVELT
jgi:MHS family proline/betaine transporter-like MFS transporter